MQQRCLRSMLKVMRQGFTRQCTVTLYIPYIYSIDPLINVSFYGPQDGPCVGWVGLQIKGGLRERRPWQDSSAHVYFP